MIYTVSRRTDIPAFYWDWFADKLFRGSCMIRNPQFPEKVSEYSLLPEDVDMFYFLSKNYGPALRHPRYPLLAVVQNYRCMFEYTITPYERDLERFVPHPSVSVGQFIEISKMVGKECIAWGYDPICISEKYTVEFHKEHFKALCELLAPYAEYGRVNFVNFYNKVKRNATSLRVPTENEKAELLAYIAQTADSYGLRMQCCPDSPFVDYGFHPQPCLPISKIESRFDVKSKKRNKEKCLMCSSTEQARDIGVYESCGHGCLYCYATNNHEEALKKIKAFDYRNPMLLDTLRGDEIISHARTKVFV